MILSSYIRKDEFFLIIWVYVSRRDQDVNEVESSPTFVGFFVCGNLVDYLQTLQNAELVSILFKSWENTQKKESTLI